MPPVADPRVVQKVIEDALEVAKHLGIPAVSLTAAGAQLLVELGFDVFLGGANRILVQRRIAEAAGEASARASVATHARMHAAEAVAMTALRFEIEPTVAAELVVAARGSA